MIAYASSHTAAAEGLLQKIESIILFPLMSIMVSLALLYFLWGAYEFVANAENESARATGKMHMLWGIIGMLVMLSAYAIIKIAGCTFGIAVPGGSC